METKSTRYFYALLYPNRNFDDSLDLIREWGTAHLMRFASKSERDEAVAADGRIVPCSAKDANYIAYNNIDKYFREA